MIAIGGAIGTGLIIGTGKALAQAGPGSLFILYTIIGSVVFLIMAAVGEMAAWLPISAGFTAYATRFCDPALGFALGWWDTVNPGVFIAIFLVLIMCINFFGIRFFGEFEFWLSAVKIVTIIGIIIFLLVLALGGGPDYDRKGFRYWQNPGAFKLYINEGASGCFLGFWSCMINATFVFMGTELVGVTVAEAQNLRKTIPKAIKLMYYRILIFYCLSVLLVGMIILYNSEKLVFVNQGDKKGASASPFVVAAEVASVRVVPHIINAAILIFVISASNTDIYISSRTLYALASDGLAPKIFKKTNENGVPVYALGVLALFCGLAFINIADDSTKVFGYFVNLTTIFALMTWILILVTYIYWCKARKAQKIDDEALAYVAPFGVYGTYAALFMCILVAIIKNYDVFVGDFSEKYKTFITGYLGIPVYLILLFGYKFVTRTLGIKPYEADFYSGKAAIDREEEEFLAQKAAEREMKDQSRASWFYEKFVSWLF
ncbi:Dicarboxylic amino acid permease [Fusarium oxysporum f. sp. narcissi]|uniref:Dicarboxylic amino acid permease n=1 Tax=Fusarium oxysporum f. sp. narcissi TaxID=451672 RepID=A0A4Q2VGG4_FUSOX|nr:Dicarboxylic amino acid permease [Fusarium oxysporum f. sp. narcissi]